MGVSAAGIRLVMEMEDIPKYKWFTITQKILHYISEYKKADDGKQESSDRHRS